MDTDRNELETLMTHDYLQRIWDKHSLGEIKSIDKPAQGFVNLCLIINDRYVIRFDTLGDEDQAERYQTEHLVYTMLHGMLPVPEVIVLDETRTLAPVNYLITTRLEGKPMIESWPLLTRDQQYSAAFEAGQYLAEMHSQTHFERFGQPHQVADGQGFAAWYDYVNDFAERYMQEANELQALDNEMLNRIAAVMKALKPVLKLVQHASLVHSDYHFENVLQAEGSITGIIDFEWAVTGDPAWDFRVEDKWEEMCPGSRDIVYAGYRSRRTIPAYHEQRVALYKLLMWLDNIVLTTFRPNPVDYQHSFKELMQQLRWLEQH